MFRARYAILLDGGFVTKKFQTLHNRATTADDVNSLCIALQRLPQVSAYELLRTYYYDAHPSSDSIKRPVSGDPYDLGSTARHQHSQSLLDKLVLKPGFALRMGEVRLSPFSWKLKSKIVDKELKITPRELTDDDFQLDISQKGVDMRIGLDMARLALRDLVRAVVVVTGDSDFVPAFKFARREGVKVILATLGHNVRTELKAHSDFTIGESLEKLK